CSRRWDTCGPRAARVPPRTRRPAR
ncbi:MAG: hypothetical protein AVDCRST_MAG29-1887, partial [uncultured Nocardioidaceae bacterium]